jgi:benzoylformate decarboxylase
MPHPLVKWSYEVPRAQDVPLALARAAHLANLPPKGPVFVSIPMDDWAADVDDDDVRHNTTRHVNGRAAADPAAVRDLAARIQSASTPALVAGPDIDASGGWDSAIALAERQRLPVWAIPAPGGGRLGFPEGHALFQGILPPAIGPVGEVLAPYDLVLVAGASVFSYYPNIPGPLLREGTSLVAITSDPDEAARAPMGDAIVADVKLTLDALLAELGDSESGRELPPERGAPETVELTDPMSPTTARATLGEVLPDDAIIVIEAPTTTIALRNQLRISRPGSFYFGAGGGLGFGLAAAVGVGLAKPDYPVVCVVGEGSAQYAIQSFWSAVAYDVPVTFLVVRNEEYSILKWFGMLEQVEGVPGLDLPRLDVASVAAGYGVNARHASDQEELRELLRDAIASDRPELVEVRVAPGMALA